MKEKIKKIKLLALDVDGVMTKGDIIYDSEGKEIKIFNAHDGFGIVLIQKAGYKTAILSAKKAKAVTLRAKRLRVNKAYQNAFPKIYAYEKMLKDFNVKDKEVCFVGDDLFDLPVLKRVGFSVAVKNAAPELKRQVDYVTKRCGGDGAVREVIELILKTTGKWKKLLEGMEKFTCAL